MSNDKKFMLIFLAIILGCAIVILPFEFMSRARGEILLIDPSDPIKAYIDIAADGDTLLLAPGTYSGPGCREIDFQGKEIALIGRYGARKTIIDLEHKGRGFFCQTGETKHTIIQGIAWINGDGRIWGSGYAPMGSAGIIFNSSPTIKQCIFANCYADEIGSCLYIAHYANPTIYSCHFRANEARIAGAIYINFYSTPLIKKCILVNNESTDTGAAIYIFDSCPKIEKCVIMYNHSQTGAGGINCTGQGTACLDTLDSIVRFNKLIDIQTSGGCLKR